MPTSDLDLPLLPSADQIRRREFATVRRGYDPDQVRDYLLQVADQVQVLEHDLREARLSAGTRPAEAKPEPAPDPYERLASRFASIIENADREAERVIEEARVESARMIAEARIDADRIRVDAQARAEEARQQGTEALQRAREEAERILGGLAQRRESLVAQMHEMQARLLSVAEDLDVVIADRDEARGSAEGEPDGEALEDGAFEEEAFEEEARLGRAFEEDAFQEPAEDDPVDPRYEDLWVSTDQVDIPDLASIELDFDEDSRGRD